jgi:hypothetical protein
MDNPDLSNSEAFSAFFEELRLQIQTFVKSVCHAKVDAIVMGMNLRNTSLRCPAVLVSLLVRRRVKQS